jgi:hypothetical protein
VYGPLPNSLCYFKQALRSSFFVELLLLFNASALAKYFYIYHLQNPLGFSDEYWCWFGATAIKIFSIVSQFVWHALTPRQPINYFVCTGKDPTKYSSQPFHVYGFFEILTIFVHIFVYIKIKRYKDQGPDCALKKDSQNKRLLSIEKTSLLSLLLNLVYIFLLITSTFFMMLATKMEPAKLIIFPNSLIIHFTSLLLPGLIGSIMVCLFYIKHKSLRVAFVNYFFGVKEIDVIA